MSPTQRSVQIQEKQMGIFSKKESERRVQVILPVETKEDLEYVIDLNRRLQSGEARLALRKESDEEDD